MLKKFNNEFIMEKVRASDNDMQQLKKCSYITDYEIPDEKVMAIANVIKYFIQAPEIEKLERAFYKIQLADLKCGRRAIASTHTWLQNIIDNNTLDISNGLKNKIDEVLSEINQHIESYAVLPIGRPDTEYFIHRAIFSIQLILRPDHLPGDKKTLAEGLHEMFNAFGLGITTERFQDLLVQTACKEIQ